MNEEMDFGEALFALKNGHAVTRKGWNGKGMFLMLQHTIAEVCLTHPYIWMMTANGHRVPWTASQTDMLAEDWLLLEPQPK